MREWKINDGQRMTINLGTMANAVVDQDMLEFQSRSLSDFICCVFKNFYQDANASIGRTLEREETSLLSVLDAKYLPQDTCHKVVDLLEAHTHYPKGSTTENVRLQNATVKIIKSCEYLENQYYPRISSYIKAVIEEYCRLPYIRREKIYFKDSFKRISDAIQEKKQLEVTVQDGRRFLVHPCYILSDKLDTANYLAGFSRYPGEKIRQRIPASFRIASLINIDELEDQAVVGKEDRSFLDKKIETRGVQFLLNQETVVRVKLTENGQFKLSRMTALRPRCARREGDIYTFECTELQAEYYFTSMGADCEVLEPLSLRSKFADIYLAASKEYNK